VSRHEATFRSPTGGYVVVAVVDGENGWAHLEETLRDRGYVLDGVNGDAPPTPPTEEATS
jgi:hypothetical protein